jgi:hypothetical protein
MATILWIVAIERYGPVGSMDELNFPVPIGDYAFDLIQKVLARSPETRIVFNQSLPDDQANQDKLQSLHGTSVEIGGATAQDLREALGKLKFSDSLIIYWIGHGLMVNNRRLMLSSESTAAGDLVTIEVDSILTRLRSADYAMKQIGFFDVCAHLYPTPPATFSMGGDGGVPKDQFFYFSAAAAETAAINPGEPGFSSTVIDELSNPARPFPPDPVALFDELRKRFLALKLGSRAFPLQRTEHSGSEWTREGAGYSREIEKYASAADCDVTLFDHLRQQAGNTIALHELSEAVRHGRVDELIQRLREGSTDQHVPNLLQDAWNRTEIAERLERTSLRMRLTWSAWLSLYEQIVAIDRLQEGAAPDNLAHMYLKVLSQPRDRGRESLVRLLELAAQKIRLGSVTRANELLMAVRRDAALGPIYAQAVQALPVPSGPVFLLLGISIPFEQPPSVEESWVYVNGEKDLSWKHGSTETSLPRQINALVESAKRIYSERDLVVELLAPIELLCSPRELFEVKHSTMPVKIWLEKISAFTLRWHDRMKPGDEFFSGTWKQRAAVTKRRVSQSPTLDCTWAGEAPGGHVVGIPFPGPSLDEQWRNGQEYFDLLATGEPYMCWPRNPPADLEAFKQKVSSFVSLHPAHESRFARLAEALKVAKATGDPVLGDLWLFVDEPERNPYDDQFVEATE